MQSLLQTRGPVSFPPFAAERHYMIPFTKRGGLPTNLSRWQPTIDQMLVGVDTDETMFVMIDQKMVLPGQPQRRPGVHIDGYWIANADGGKWDNGKGDGRWKQVTRAGGKHDTGSHIHGSVADQQQEALLLASDVQGCNAWTGEWDDRIGDGGDCTHVDLSPMDEHRLQPFQTYALNVTGLHASVPLSTSVAKHRTLVRINVPNWHFA